MRLFLGISVAASVVSANFVVTAGEDACEITNGGMCVTDGDGNYGNSESCTIRAEVSMTLTVNSFGIESHSSCGWDYLEVGGTRYCGTSGPDGVQLAAGATMSFVSDSSSVRSGFVICQTLSPPPEPPPVPPMLPSPPGTPLPPLLPPSLPPPSPPPPAPPPPPPSPGS